MKHWNADDKRQRDGGDLDTRLAAYYGPQLREQPLSQVAWHDLSRQLKKRKKNFPQQHWRGWRRKRAILPASVQDACRRVASEIRSDRMATDLPSKVRCTYKTRMCEPRVYVSGLPGSAIRLFLPREQGQLIGKSELDMLIASGVARYHLASRSSYVLTRLLLTCVALSGCIIALIASQQRLLLPGIASALLLWASSFLLMARQQRSMAFVADRLVVQWLGRGQTCQALHALADRSRTPRRPRWGEPSLVERIERVCGTRMEEHNERLTLVR